MLWCDASFTNYVSIYMCLYVCMYVYVHMYICTYIYICIYMLLLQTMYLYICAFMYVCMCIYIYMYMHKSQNSYISKVTVLTTKQIKKKKKRKYIAHDEIIHTTNINNTTHLLHRPYTSMSSSTVNTNFSEVFHTNCNCPFPKQRKHEVLDPDCALHV